MRNCRKLSAAFYFRRDPRVRLDMHLAAPGVLAWAVRPAHPIRRSGESGTQTRRRRPRANCPTSRWNPDPEDTLLVAYVPDGLFLYTVWPCAGVRWLIVHISELACLALILSSTNLQNQWFGRGELDGPVPALIRLGLVGLNLRKIHEMENG